MSTEVKNIRLEDIDLEALIEAYYRLQEKANSIVGMPIHRIGFNYGCKRYENSQYVPDMVNLSVGFDGGDNAISVVDYYAYGSDIIKYATDYDSVLRDVLSYRKKADNATYRRMYMNNMSREVVTLCKVIKDIYTKYDISHAQKLLLVFLPLGGDKSVVYEDGVFVIRC